MHSLSQLLPLLSAAGEAAPAASEIAFTFKLSAIDIFILVGAIAFNLSVGAFFARRQTGTKSYFLGGGTMPGWLVGFSITASMISAVTFLGIPGFSFKENWLWVLPNLSFLFLGFLCAYFIVPFFRKVNTPSGYAFLEQRYGVWARVYAAVGFMSFNMIRLGVVLYITGIALEEFIPFGQLLQWSEGAMGAEFPGLLHEPIFWVILLFGAVATIYTMCGGFEAVVWTDFFQSMLFIFGGATLLPVILYGISQTTDLSMFGSLQEIFSRAAAAGKLSFGSTEFTFHEIDGRKTVWVMILSTLFMDASNYTTRQDLIQRYRAPKNLFHARMAVIIGACTVVPIWLYFNCLGTSLWAYYEINPDVTVETFRNVVPEKIVPYFMAQYLPTGLKGFFLAAILTASLSTMAPMLNACTVTWVDDFYHRFIVRNKPDLHYMRVGRVSTCIIGIFMIVSALLIYAFRSQTLQNLQQTFAMICSMGLFGLFMVGFFSKRVGNRAAKYAACVVVPLGLLWTAAFFMKKDGMIPEWVWVPDIFWMTVLMNLIMIALALLFAAFLPKEKRNLDNLTIHTVHENKDAQ